MLVCLRTVSADYKGYSFLQFNVATFPRPVYVLLTIVEGASGNRKQHTQEKDRGLMFFYFYSRA